MASSNAPTVEPHTVAAAVRRILRITGARVAAVVDRGRLEGVIYRSTVLAFTSTKVNALARDIMEEPPFTLQPSMTIGEAARLMFKYDEWYGFIVDENRKYLGVLGLEDIIRVALENYPRELGEHRVEEAMTRDVTAVSPDDSLQRLWNLMKTTRYAGFPVVDGKNRLIGIVTQYDLIRKGYTRVELESESGPAREPKVREAMTTGVVAVYPWTTLMEAAQLMAIKSYGRLPVIESPKSRRLVGVIDREDVVRFMLVGR
ncbi:CBS domain-containing protein [Stetteria hydrogenophila]